MADTMHIDKRLDQIEVKLDYLIHIITTDEDETEEQFSFNGEQIWPDRDQTQSL